MTRAPPGSNDPKTTTESFKTAILRSSVRRIALTTHLGLVPDRDAVAGAPSSDPPPPRGAKYSVVEKRSVGSVPVLPAVAGMGRRYRPNESNVAGAGNVLCPLTASAAVEVTLHPTPNAMIRIAAKKSQMYPVFSELSRLIIRASGWKIDSKLVHSPQRLGIA